MRKKIKRKKYKPLTLHIFLALIHILAAITTYSQNRIMKKIVSYNVNGIRAAMKKDLIGFLEQGGFDIVGFQELKAMAGQFDVGAFEKLGYHCHWFSAQKKGYSGVGLISKQQPDYVENGCGIELYDYEGRIIRADFGEVTVLSCYFPSGTSGSERQAVKMQFLSDFKSWIDDLRKTRPNLIIMGDYNIANHEIDVYNPDKAKRMSGFLPEERAWLTDWFDDGFHDAFRVINPEMVQYSWWSYRRNNRASNRGWRIDYQSVSDSLVDKVKAAHQLTDAVHSDHCPVYLEIDF